MIMYSTLNLQNSSNPIFKIQIILVKPTKISYYETNDPFFHRQMIQDTVPTISLTF